MPVASQQDLMPSLTVTNLPGGESPTRAQHDLIRSEQERRDHPEPHLPSTKQRISHQKQVKAGFPCPGCNEIFDRACDQKKHHQRTHTPITAHSYSCSHCSNHASIEKRFMYPKDLRRHLEQVHNIATNSVSSYGSTASTDSTETPAATPKVTIWMLTKILVKFKRLRTSQTHRNLIMVSADEISFVAVAVSGVESAAALSSRILSALGRPPADDPNITAQTYSRRLGQITLGYCLDKESLYSLVVKAADTQGSLKFLVKIEDQNLAQVEDKGSHNMISDSSAGSTYATSSKSATAEQSGVLEDIEEETDICALPEPQTSIAINGKAFKCPFPGCDIPPFKSRFKLRYVRQSLFSINDWVINVVQNPSGQSQKHPRFLV